MRYQIPQFINIKDKIFGPFTFKQFVYLAGGAAACYLLWRLLPMVIAILAIVPTAGFALALAFYKIHNRPFVEVLQAAFIYGFNGKFYLWKQQTKNSELSKRLEEEHDNQQKQEGTQSEDEAPTFSESKLRDLSWSLDVVEMNGNSNQQPEQDNNHSASSDDTQEKDRENKE